MQQQFLQQQHQYLQHQLQHIQQQQQQQQQHLQQPPPTEHHWGIQGQVVPRPALPAHMLPYAMQSILPRPYSQPSTFTPRQHQVAFPQYPPTYHSDPNKHPTYHSDSNAPHYAIANPYLLHQQKPDAHNFANFAEHTPSPSPSPNPPPLSPNVEEYQTDAIGSVSFEPSGAIPKDNSKVVSYSNQNFTHSDQTFTQVEYPSPAQSPVELPAEDVVSNSRQSQNVGHYSVPISNEVVASMKYPSPAVVINSVNELPTNRTPYEASSCVGGGINSAVEGYSSTVLNSAVDLSCSTTNTNGHAIVAEQTKTPSKLSPADLHAPQSPLQGHSKELGLNAVVLNSPIPMPHSPAGLPVPSSPYTSCLPNPPPNSPAVVSPAVITCVPHPTENIMKFQQLIDNVNNYASEKTPDCDETQSENILKPVENMNIKHHGNISGTKPVFQDNLDENATSYPKYNNGYMGAFAAMIKEDEETEYGNKLGNEESANCEEKFNPLINQKNKETNVDKGQCDLSNTSDTEEQKINFMPEENKEVEPEYEKKKPFKFSPFLYRYLNNEQKEDGIETLDWCSEMCTPPDSPLATNSSTPTSSPTAKPVPLITLTPCASYLYTSDENCSAISELRDEQGVLCQGGDILMRTADGSLRIVGSPVKFDDTTITAGSMSPSHQLESPTQSAAASHLPKSATSSPGSDILGDIMTQVGLVGVSAEEDMCLDEDVIGVMEGKGPSPSFVGEANEMGYHQQRQFACHLCHCVFHDAWNLQVHMVSHPTPTPRPRRRSKTSVSSPENSSASLYVEEYSEFIPPHLTPSLPKGTKFRRGGRKVGNKENATPQPNMIGKFLCPECNIGYPSLGHMNRHRESHGANRKFPCDMCTASYSRRDNLDKHRNMHLIN